MLRESDRAGPTGGAGPVAPPRAADRGRPGRRGPRLLPPQRGSRDLGNPLGGPRSRAGRPPQYRLLAQRIQPLDGPDRRLGGHGLRGQLPRGPRVRRRRRVDPRRRVSVIENPLSTRRLQEGLANVPRSSLGILDGEQVVGMVATVRPIKDYATFLRSARLVLDKHPNTRFLAIGDQEVEYAREMRRLGQDLGIDGRVSWVGPLANPISALPRVDVAVLSSRSEAFSNALLEYAAAGVAAVATDVGGSREIVQNAVTGFLVPPRSPELLADRVSSPLGEPGAAAANRATRPEQGSRTLVGGQDLAAVFPVLRASGAKMSDAVQEVAPATADVARSAEIEVSVCGGFQTASGGADAWNRLVDVLDVSKRFSPLGVGQHLVEVVWRQSRVAGAPPDPRAAVDWHCAVVRGADPLRRKTTGVGGAGDQLVRSTWGRSSTGTTPERRSGPSRPACARAPRWDSIAFLDVPPDDLATTSLVAALAGRFPAIRYPGEVCRYFRVPETYEALLKRLSSHGRQRERRQRRRAGKELDARLEILSLPDTIARAFPDIVRLSASSKGKAGQRSPFLNPRYLGFHREVCEQLSRVDIARVYVLHFRGRPAAFIYGFTCHQKFSFFQTGYDADASAYSPGNVVFQMVCEQLIAQGTEEFDYLRGEEEYKSQFGDLRRCTETVLLFRHANHRYAGQWIRSNLIALAAGR